MEWFVIWLLFGLITGVAAAGKNRNFLGWAFLGFLLGPFGFILVLLMPKISDEKKVLKADPDDLLPANFSESPENIECPFCAEVIKARARVCRFCGHDFGQPVSQFIADRK